jgi:hypothetical protein
MSEILVAFLSLITMGVIITGFVHYHNSGK